MSKPTVTQLENSPEFILIEAFKVEEMGTFLAKIMQGNATKAPKQPWFFLVLMALLGAFVGYFLGSFFSKFLSGDAWVQMGIAFVAFWVVLLPLHELIHGIVFKALGAKQIGFGWTWKGWMAYCYAQNFVITLQELIWVAIMPFICLTLGMLCLLFVLPSYQIAIIFALLLHTTGCLGDFLLVKYARQNKNRQIYTFDDLQERKMTFFYEKISSY